MAALLSLAFIILSSSLLELTTSQTCGINNEEKFNCSSLNILSNPSIIYKDVPFTIDISTTNESSLLIVNASLFISTNGYCDPDSFTNGVQCLVESSEDYTNSTITCPGGLPVGPVALVVGLADCAFPLYVKWGQLPTLTIMQGKEELDVVGNIYVVRDLSLDFDVICSVSPTSDLYSPTLTVRSLNTSSTPPGLNTYQRNNNKFAVTFKGGFSSQFSGVYNCSSAFNVSTILYIVTTEDIPTVYYPNGDTVHSIIVGSPLMITAAVLTDRPVDTDTVQFMRLSSDTPGTPSPSAPTAVVQLVEEDEYDQTFYITFNAVSLDSAGLYSVCFSYFDGNSSDIGSGSQPLPVMNEVLCIGTFNISFISVPVVNAQTSLVVERSTSFANGSVSVSCVPSDLGAIIRWQFLSGVPLWDEYPSYVFQPPGLNHTVTLTSPPYGILLIECGLYDPGMTRLVNGIEITVVAVSRSVSVWNNNNELMSGSIINSFRMLYHFNTPFLSLRCFAREGHGELQWRTKNVSSLSETLSDKAVPGLSVVGTGQDLTLNYADIDTNDTGYYVCYSRMSGESFEVFTTLDDPYFNIFGPSFIRAPIGTNVSLVLQYAFGSEGYGNIGSGYMLALRIQPSDTRYSAFYAVNSTALNSSSYNFIHTFTVGVFNTGVGTFEVTRFNDTVFNESGQFLAITPVFSPLPITPVYALLGRRVNISCSPNETAAPVNWAIEFTNSEVFSSLFDVPDFDLSPPGLNHMLEFNLTTSTFTNDQFSVDVDSGSISQVLFTCGFRNGDNLRSYYNQSRVTVNIRQERISLTQPRITIRNNSIVNSFHYQFINHKSKRSLSGGISVSVTCSTVQGDHYPFFKAELFSQPGVILSIDDTSDVSDIRSFSSGTFERTLSVHLHHNTSGRYYCESAVSGVFNTFILTSDNPFIRAVSGNILNAFLGEEVTIGFLAARNSRGSYNSLYSLPILFTSETGSTSNLNSIQSCGSSPCYYFRLLFRSVRPSSAGQYTAYISPDDEYEYEYYYGELNNDIVNETITLNVEVPQLVTSGPVTQALLDEEFPLTCKPSKGSFLISWRHNGESLNCDGEDRRACRFANNQQDTLILSRISLSDAGTYTCTLMLGDEGIISQNITLEITQRCPMNFSNGILWGETDSGTVARVPCTAAGSQFQSGLLATRACSGTARWELPDMTTCLLKERSTDVASVWVTVDTTNSSIPANNTVLIEALEDLLKSVNISYDSVNLQSTYTESQSALFEFRVDLSSSNESQLTLLNELSTIITSAAQFGSLYVLPLRSGIQIFASASSCPCLSDGISITYLCSEGATTPCSCNGDTCQCVPPFVGDGVLCTIDSDGDSFPDEPLSSCTVNDTQNYCIQDNCVRTFNPNQDLAACQILENFEGCGFGIDTEWGIAWANTLVGEVDRQPCPGDAATLGTATKACLTNGVWGETNVLDCLPVEYQNYLNEVESILDANISVDAQLERLADLVSQLATSTSEVIESLELFLPGSINATNNIVDSVIDVLFNSLDEGSDNISNITDSLDLAGVFDNLLDSSQLAAWQQLHEAPNELQGSNVLLGNAERYGKYLALSRNESLVKRRRNIVINANQYSAASDPLVFPQPGDTEGTLFTPERAAEVSIPPQLLRERKTAGEATVPVVSILFKNLENFLEADGSTFNNTRPGSIVWSGQVSQMIGSTEYPISLRFNVNNFANTSGYKCVYWNTTRRAWSLDGVDTLFSSVDSTTGRTSVHCRSYHLTAFAVLVDVSGSITETNPTEYVALKVVSYIGCAVSIACLTITVIFFLIQGKVLLRSVHFFIHLNLAIALLCGYFIFAVGVETARNSSGGCAFVAALLQYFFLSSFCWMLCEGVMLYLMLVKVFSTLSKRWYFFLILGWIPPLFPVVIGLAAGHNDYGVKNDEGALLYCWLSVDNGVIWAFVAPMIIIIIINSVFLALALYAIWKTRRNQQSIKKQTNTRDLALTLLKASFVLLPLLGMTWLFGLLAVNRNTSAFAWIFTLLNSLQGAAIFFFHVIRSDKVWSKLSPRLEKVKRGITTRTKYYDFMSRSSTMLKSNDSQSSITMNTIKRSVAENEYSNATSLGFGNPSVIEDNDDIEMAKLKEKDLKKEEEEEEEEMSLSERAREKEKEALQSEEESKSV